MTSEKVPPSSLADSYKGGGGDTRQPNLSPHSLPRTLAGPDLPFPAAALGGP